MRDETAGGPSQLVAEGTAQHDDVSMKDPLQTDAAVAIGRVAAPPNLEATPNRFHFWVSRGKLVENNQFVRTESTVDGNTIRFYGMIDEVRRTSRKRDILEEYDGADGDVGYEPPFKTEGVTYARANILRTEPDIQTPPLEQSEVIIGGEADARLAYDFDSMSQPMPVGLLRNGAGYAGQGQIDLAYLLGENGGHLNVNGMAGVGTKTSFLLTVIKLLQRQAQLSMTTRERLHIAPIILNVKGEDLMWIDRPNRHFIQDHRADWERFDLQLEPSPFADATFYAPTNPLDGSPTVKDCDATPYSWSFADVIGDDSLPYIFSEEDNLSENMSSLVREIVATLTERDGRTLKEDSPRTWGEFLGWMRDERNINRMYGVGTWWAVYRRLSKVLDEGKNIFLRDEPEGKPLRVTRTGSAPPQVIDIHSLPLSLQRFVVASIVRQVVAARSTGTPVRGLRYLIMLDELNRFAPRGGRDEITRLLERVATEMRSQGVILLGAQQMASQVSARVIEMCSVRVLGRTGAAELQDKVWQSWEQSARRQATLLQNEDKLVMQPTFRQPMLVRIPFPAWAMKREDIAARRGEGLPEV